MELKHLMIENSFVKKFGTLHICDMNFKPCHWVAVH